MLNDNLACTRDVVSLIVFEFFPLNSSISLLKQSAVFIFKLKAPCHCSAQWMLAVRARVLFNQLKQLDVSLTV